MKKDIHKADTIHHRIAIIGAGFSGLGAAISLKRSGEDDFIVFEKEAGVGGTWYVNQYPGCACDIPSHVYSYSFAPNPKWSRMYAPQKEIRDYLHNCALRFGVLGRIRLSTAVESAYWSDEDELWYLQADGKQYSANVLIVGAGGLSTPSIPDLPGLDNFKGHCFHSQQWDYDYDLTGKKVAVIGTGASAIQFVPEIQPKVEKLSVFQRTPPWIVPKADRPIAEAEQKIFEFLPRTQRAFRDALYWMLESRAVLFTKNFGLADLPEKLARRHIRHQIKDRALRKAVTPDYRFGCKRVLISNNYYPALEKENCDLVTSGIKEIQKDGILTEDGVFHPCDAIIFGTGFRATDPIPAGAVFGSGGKDIAELWKDGPEAYKGCTVSGFPNMFILMGPNTGLGHNSMIHIIESQIAYVLDALKTMKKKRIKVIDVKPKAQKRYNEKLQSQLSETVWNAGGCQSWYIHPESGKNVTLWPGFTWQFRRITRKFDVKAYRDLARIKRHETKKKSRRAPAGA